MVTWNKPTLVILGKSNIEEAVLSYCKCDGLGGPTVTNCLTGDYEFGCSELNPS